MSRQRDTTVRNYLELALYSNQTCEICGGKFAVGDKIHVNSFHQAKRYYHLKHWEKLLH